MDIIDENTLIGLSNGSVDPENVSIQEQLDCSIPVIDKEGNVYDLRQYFTDIEEKGSVIQRIDQKTDQEEEESTIDPPYKPEVNEYKNNQRSN